MSRTLTDAMATVATSEVVRPILLVQCAFDSGALKHGAVSVISLWIVWTT